MYLLSQIKRNPAITTVTKRGIFGGGRGLLSSSLRNIKTLLIYESGSLGQYAASFIFRVGFYRHPSIQPVPREHQAPFFLLSPDATSNDGADGAFSPMPHPLRPVDQIPQASLQQSASVDFLPAARQASQSLRHFSPLPSRSSRRQSWLGRALSRLSSTHPFFPSKPPQRLLRLWDSRRKPSKAR